MIVKENEESLVKGVGRCVCGGGRIYLTMPVCRILLGINFSPEVRMLLSSGHRDSISHTRVLWPLSGEKKRARREGL